MRVIIAGSRDIENYILVVQAIEESGFDITEVVCGEARGVDKLGKLWAKEAGIPVKSFPADWGRYKKRAGPIRNEQMAKYGDALVVVTRGTPGTKDMINRAVAHGLQRHIKRVRT